MQMSMLLNSLNGKVKDNGKSLNCYILFNLEEILSLHVPCKRQTFGAGATSPYGSMSTHTIQFPAAPAQQQCFKVNPQ
jgi:hypothetical protein